MNNIQTRITKISFISLALIPLLKANYNSIIIIICALLTIFDIIKSKRFIKFRKEYFILTTLFWMFLFHEIISLDFNFDRILRQLPFIVFPLLFFYKPPYIDDKIKRTSISVFQISTILQCIIYLIIFLYSNSISKMFFVSNENIPFFREYVLNNSFFEIHPTYFSAFLLVSITISLFQVLKRSKKITTHIINILGSIFFMFLFSSRVVIVLMFLTFVFFVFSIAIKKKPIQALFTVLISVVLIGLLFLPSKNVIKERFDEIRTEIDKPIVGNYYNSTNTRVAIIKCTLILIKDVPFFGFGDELQKELNDCYGRTNDSEFYKISTFNTHNYYFNLILYGGWLFLLLFLIYIYYIYNNLKYSDVAVFILIQLLIINLTENFLSRHYGIVLFTYLTSMFFFFKEKENKLQEIIK